LTPRPVTHPHPQRRIALAELEAARIDRQLDPFLRRPDRCPGQQASRPFAASERSLRAGLHEIDLERPDAHPRVGHIEDQRARLATDRQRSAGGGGWPYPLAAAHDQRRAAKRSREQEENGKRAEIHDRSPPGTASSSRDRGRMPWIQGARQR
jgi:hypothetical protein